VLNSTGSRYSWSWSSSPIMPQQIDKSDCQSFYIWLEPPINPTTKISLSAAYGLSHIWDPMTNQLLVRFFATEFKPSVKQDGYLSLKIGEQNCYVHLLFERAATSLEWMGWCLVQSPENFTQDNLCFESYESECPLLRVRAELLSTDSLDRRQFILRLSKVEV